MAEQNTSSVDDPSAEFLATTGLVTMLGAVVAGVIAVVTLSGGSAPSSDRPLSEDGALPFPSWLRNDAEPAAELSALG